LYEKPSVFLQLDDSVSFTVVIEEDGLYTVSFDMSAAESPLTAPEGQLLVDGDFPIIDTRRIVFPVFFQNTLEEFPLDRYGNEALIPQEMLIRWTKVPMRDANFSQKYPLQIQLAKGEHNFEFKVIKESMFLGSIYIQKFTNAPTYDQYLKDNPAPNSSGVFIELEAEFPSYKNDTSIRPVNSRSLEVTPYDTYRLLLNTIGGESWKISGTTVYYEFTVPEDGMYFITLHAIQNFKNNLTIFRRITINDTVLFDELNEIPFNYSTEWTNILLGGDKPFKIYLNKGVNVGIEANVPYYTAIEN
jgi:hypothetical protein